MPNNVFEALPKSLQQDIQLLPADLLIELLQDTVEAYKQRMTSYQAAEALLQEVEQELAQQSTAPLPAQTARQQFLEIRNAIIAKYF